MKLNKASRSQSRIRMAISGPSGAGKTLSSLKIAKGLTGDLSRVCIIDTESGSANMYADLGNYNVLQLDDHTPEAYIKALQLCEARNMACVIIDSMSHCWETLLDNHSRMSGNSFANWSVVMPRHKALINAILNSPLHVLATFRAKQEWVVSSDEKGKMKPEKVGLKPVSKDDVTYEFDIHLELDSGHNAWPSKDRTGLFAGEEYRRFIPDEKTGQRVRKWISEAVSGPEISVASQIAACESLEALKEVWDQIELSVRPKVKELFQDRRRQLQTTQNGMTT